MEKARSVEAVPPELRFFAGPDDKYSILPAKTAVIFIGGEAKHFDPNDPMYSGALSAMKPRLQTFLAAARRSGMLVVHVVSALRGDGSDIGRLRDIRPMLKVDSRLFNEQLGLEIMPQLFDNGDITVKKRRYSAFFATDLDLVLRSNEIDTVVVCGIITNGCCEDTARDAFKLDYKVIFLSDGTATNGLPDMGWGVLSAEEAQRVTLTFVAGNLGRVATLDEVTREIDVPSRGETAPA